MIERVFIVGMYKSGTSWLLAALASHPEILGVREVDFFKALGERGLENYRLKPVNERVNHVFGGSAWCGIQTGLHAPGEIRRFMSAPELEQAVDKKHLHELEPKVAINVLGRLLAEKRLRKTPGKKWTTEFDQGFPTVKFGKLDSEDRNRPISCVHQSAERLQELFIAVRDADDPLSAAETFLSTVAANAHTESRIVFKAADMLARLPLLDKLQPGVKKIVIVRDGRDAAISASHYQELMNAEQMPWNKTDRARKMASTRSGGLWHTAMWQVCGLLLGSKKIDYFNSLYQWARRIRIIRKLHSDPNLFVLRYEDLSRDFPAVMHELLVWLEVSATPDIVDRIQRASSFEHMSGRSRGQAATAVLRKGQTQEWIESLSFLDKLIAWTIAGTELSWLGYNRSSGLRPFKIKAKESE